MSNSRAGSLRAWDRDDRLRPHKRADTLDIPKGTVQRMRALILVHQRVQREREVGEGGSAERQWPEVRHDNFAIPPTRPRPLKASKRRKTHPRFVAPPPLPNISSLLAEQFGGLSSSKLSTPQGLHSPPKRLTASAMQRTISPRKHRDPPTPSNTPMFVPTPAELQPSQLLPGSPVSMHPLTISPSKNKKATTPSNTPLIMPTPPQFHIGPPQTISLSSSSPVKISSNYTISIANISPSKPIPDELSISTPNNTPMLLPTRFVLPPTTSTVTSFIDSQTNLSTAPFATLKPGTKIRRPITPNNTPMISTTSVSPPNLVSPLTLPHHPFRSPPSLPLNSPPTISPQTIDSELMKDRDEVSMSTLVVPDAVHETAACTISTTSARIVTPQKIPFPTPCTPTTPTPDLNHSKYDNFLSPAPQLASNLESTPPSKTPMSAPPVTISKRRALLNSRTTPSLLFSERPTTDSLTLNNDIGRESINEEQVKTSSSTQTRARALQASTERIAWLETTVARLKTEKEVETALLKHQQFVEREKAQSQIEKLKVENALLQRQIHDVEYKDVAIRKLNLTLDKLRAQYARLQQQCEDLQQGRLQRSQRRQARSLPTTRGPFRF